MKTSQTASLKMCSNFTTNNNYKDLWQCRKCLNGEGKTGPKRACTHSIATV